MTQEDELYGEALPAGAPIKPEELKWPPASRQRISTEVVTSLNEYAAAHTGNPFVSTAIRGTPLLWIIGPSGHVDLALEEVVDEHDGSPVCCLPKNVTPKSGFVKLGHPSLLEGERHARIGGELFWDTGWEPAPAWVLSNSSGRYGFRPHQTEAHLLAAARQFLSYGLYVEIDYLPGRSLP